MGIRRDVYRELFRIVDRGGEPAGCTACEYLQSFMPDRGAEAVRLLIAAIVAAIMPRMLYGDN